MSPSLEAMMAAAGMRAGLRGDCWGKQPSLMDARTGEGRRQKQNTVVVFQSSLSIVVPANPTQHQLDPIAPTTRLKGTFWGRG